MMHLTLGRVAVLALSLLGAGLQGAMAHPLPGSVLTLSHADAQLNLSISLPLEDVIVASSMFEDLADFPTEQELPADHMKRVARYFAQHLDLQHGSSNLLLTVMHASLRADETEHAGRFKLLVVELVTPVAAGADVLPLTLTYDAVMHEVRNHRAAVYWVQPGADPRRIADLGFQATPQPVLLPAP